MNSNIPKIISRIGTVIVLIAIAFILLPSFWFWVSFETIAVSFVAIGVSGEWYMHHHPAGRKKREKDDHHKLESRFIGAVALGVIMEVFALGHSIKEGVKLDAKVSQAELTTKQLEATNLALAVRVEELRKQNLELLSKLQDRRITPDQHTNLVKCLRQGAVGPVVMGHESFGPGTAEATQFAKE